MEDELVYHYCSFETFLKIIQTQTIRFSDIMKSNDRQEIIFLWDEFCKYYQNLKNLQKTDFRCISSKFFKNQMLDNTTFLASCFSSAEDQLHMWCQYAKKGVAIGFEKDALEKWSKKILLLDNKIYYSEENLENNMVSCGIVNYRSRDEVSSFISEVCDGKPLVTDNLEEIFVKACFFKNDFWKEEQEWRIIFPIYDFLQNENYKLGYNEASKIEFLPDKYFGFKTSCNVKFNPLIIKKIILAPDCKSSECDVEKILHTNGLYDIRIRKSKGSIQ